jgi:hypothetical protein
MDIRLPLRALALAATLVGLTACVGIDGGGGGYRNYGYSASPYGYAPSHRYSHRPSYHHYQPSYREQRYHQQRYERACPKRDTRWYQPWRNNRVC